MKKLVITLLFTTFLLSCHIPKNAHSIARIKEKYPYNLELTNQSALELQYRYAIVPYRKDLESLEVWKKAEETEKKIYGLGFVASILDDATFNIFGKLKNSEADIMYTGIDCGAYYNLNPVLTLTDYPNVNVDGLPARFVLAIDGDTNWYSLVYDCEKGEETNKVIITDEIIQRLRDIKQDDFIVGYNGKRQFYGKSVKIDERLYCFGKLDTKKNSLIDYSEIEGVQKYTFYGRIPLYYFFDYDKYPEYPQKKSVLILYNSNEDKFYYVKDDASVNPIY